MCIQIKWFNRTYIVRCLNVKWSGRFYQIFVAFLKNLNLPKTLHTFYSISMFLYWTNIPVQLQKKSNLSCFFCYIQTFPLENWQTSFYFFCLKNTLLVQYIDKPLTQLSILALMSPAGPLHSGEKRFMKLHLAFSKGQLILKVNFKVFIWIKKTTKIFLYFCPSFKKPLKRGRNQRLKH